MTQTELADAVGMTPQALGKIETGDTWPKYPTIQAIAGALKCKETDLISADSIPSMEILEKLNDLRDSMKTLMDEKSKRLSPQQSELLRIIEGLDAVEVGLLLKTARSFGDKAKVSATRKAR